MIEIPDDLAERLGPERERLAEIIERGLDAARAGSTALGREVITFLARGPRPQEIVSFRPSAQSVERAKDLLSKDRTGSLSSLERSELEEFSALNHWFTRIKAEARTHLKGESKAPQ